MPRHPPCALFSLTIYQSCSNHFWVSLWLTNYSPLFSQGYLFFVFTSSSCFFIQFSRYSFSFLLGKFGGLKWTRTTDLTLRGGSFRKYAAHISRLTSTGVVRIAPIMLESFLGSSWQNHSLPFALANSLPIILLHFAFLLFFIQFSRYTGQIGLRTICPGNTLRVFLG